MAANLVAAIGALVICSSCNPESEKSKIGIKAIPAEPAVIPLDPLAMLDIGKGLYPSERQWVFPINGAKAPNRQPPFMWPLKRKLANKVESIQFKVQWSKDISFESKVYESRPVRWAIAMPEVPLDPGQWYWRVRTEIDGESNWSDTYSFRIDKNTPESPFPHHQQLLNQAPSERPRTIIRSDQIESFRKHIEGTPMAEGILARAEERLSQSPPQLKLPKDEKLIDLGPRQQRKLLHGQVKDYGRQARWYTVDLLYAWIISNDPRFADAAIRFAQELAELPRDGVTHSFRNHFGNAEIMLTMALVVDCCWNQIDPDARQQIAAAAAHRAEGFVQDEWAARLEIETHKAHPWQRLLMYVADTAICLRGIVPEADSWMAYVYELWIARGPYAGGWDGGWAVGQNYLEYNAPCLVGFPHLIRESFGVELYAHPFFQEVARYATMFPWNPGFGDSNSARLISHELRPLVYSISAQIGADHYAHFLLEGYTPPSVTNTVSRNYPDYAWVNAIQESRWNETSETGPNSPIKNAAAFSGVGHAVLHSNREAIDQNLAVSFISSPFGNMGHAQREQNSFNLVYAGERLFYRTGYRIAARDPHHKGWYTATQSKNCILIDGKGQVENVDAFGRLMHFGDSASISYVSGEAAAAYNPKMEKSLAMEAMAQGLSINGEAGMETFRRHIALLRPHTIVIYDELVADHAAEWELRLQSEHEMVAQSPKKAAISGQKASAVAMVIGSSDLSSKVSDDITPAPLNWLGKQDIETGETLEYAPQYFASWSSPKQNLQRFLTVIQVSPTGEPIGQPRLEGDTIFSGGWTIKAVLDTERPAGFSATNGLSGISMQLELVIGDQTLPATPDTMIYSPNRKPVRCEKLPIMRIGNGFW